MNNVKGQSSKQELGIELKKGERKKEESLILTTPTNKPSSFIHKPSSKLTLHFSLLFAIVALVISCSSIDCKLNGGVYCRYQLKDQDLNDVAFRYPLTVTLCETKQGDTIYMNSESNVSGFDLPMSHSNNVDVIKLTLAVTDTIQEEDTTYYVTTPYTDVIRITKTNEPYFESIDCAARYNHTIEGIQSSHNFIDSLVINKKRVSNDVSTENIYIFLKSAN